MKSRNSLRAKYISVTMMGLQTYGPRLSISDYMEGLFDLRHRIAPILDFVDLFSIDATTSNYPYSHGSIPRVTIRFVNQLGENIAIFMYIKFHWDEPHYRILHMNVVNNGLVSGSALQAECRAAIRKAVTEWAQDLYQKKCYRFLKNRIAPFKEELMMNTWAPERVERLLAAGVDWDDM